MKAFMVNRYSKKDDLHLVEIPEPAIMKNEVLIQVYAAAINQLDSKIKNGEFKLILPYKTPFVWAMMQQALLLRPARKF
jgi:NADPH:quinone reductase-like Zn-dependent oxidoreductase